MAFEAAFPFAVGYVTLWLAWDEIVAATLPRLILWTHRVLAQSAPTLGDASHPVLGSARPSGAAVCAVATGRAPPPVQPGLSLSAFVSAAALAPVILLALASTWVLWIPRQTNEMLSLMTAPLLGVFVVRQLAREH